MAILLTQTGIFSSCTMDNEDEMLPVLLPIKDANVLCVKVENALKYSNVVQVKLMGFDISIDCDIELARGDWKDGGFTIVLPNSLDPNYLHALINPTNLPTTIHATPSSMTISNKNVKVGNANFWGIDKDGNVVTTFYPFKIDEGDYAKRVFFTYVDSGVTISGYFETGYFESGIDSTEHENSTNISTWYLWEKTTNYSIEWKKGWNVWCCSSVKSVPPERTITEDWFTISSSILKWYGGGDLYKLIIN